MSIYNHVHLDLMPHCYGDYTRVCVRVCVSVRACVHVCLVVHAFVSNCVCVAICIDRSFTFLLSEAAVR